jgi:DNA repair exonuclease SbcCD nuclease subunit
MIFLLCADLHLKETEKDYSFSVLNEVIGICKDRRCEALLFAGDIFDSRQAVKELRSDFRAALQLLPSSCAVYFLPGNHEQLYAADSESLEQFNFGRAQLLAKKPWSLHQFGGNAELLAIPFQRDCSTYRDWKVPPKQKPLRILLAHGIVMGMTYTPGGEDDDSIFDEDMLSHFQIDIAAVGHLHKNIIAQKGNTLVAYPGSARV